MMRLRHLVVLLLAGCSAEAAPEFDPGKTPQLSDHHPMVASLVTTLLRYQHYEPKEINDSLSEVWLEGYLKSLDFNRTTFLASDIEEFGRYTRQLDDDVLSKKPQMEAATAIYARYQQRITERITSAQASLKLPIDLTSTATWTLDRSELPWPATAEEANALWHEQVMESVLAAELHGTDRAEVLERLDKRYDRVLKDVLSAEANDVMEYYLDALTRNFDPHSVYFKPATSDDFDIEISNSVEGIGAQLRTEGMYTTIVRIIPGGPADLDGTLQPGDKIIAVAQGTSKPEDIIDLRIDRVVRQIRGSKGTEVRLTIIPVDAADNADTSIVPLIRDQVALTESDAERSTIQVGDETFGVIDVPSFYMDSSGRKEADPEYKSVSSDVRRLIGELDGESIDGLILDLRGNGGGSLYEAVELSGLFVSRGPMVQVRDREGNTEVLKDPDNGTVYEGPLVVLTDPLSASASEIVAGAIQDYGRGLVVGATTTHGKGTVQQVVDLDMFIERMTGGNSTGRAGALKVTTQKFYRVSGGSTQNRGVLSDVVLPSPWDGLDVFESDLDNALQWDEIAPARYTPVGSISGLDTLRTGSSSRVAASEDFQTLLDNLAERERRSEETEISLNIEVRRQQLESDDAGEPEEESEESEEVEVNDFILREAGEILSDYIEQSG
ncbi:MAG: carboxyl-terminal processing protease [Myxococcota bacterium]|jgi:carboxyl-terminal processing protease